MLPQLAPMLAVPAAPFDSPQYVFEVKWDGVRALAAVEAGGWRLWGRGLADYTARYPELAVLRQLPPGTLLDGELVVLAGGRADLARLLARHQLVAADRIRWAPRWCPVQYLVFDLLYHAGRCLVQEPLRRRRALLAEVCAERALPGVHFSAGVVGSGQAFYAAVVATGHEGVMAKALAAAYRPGRRSPAWRKIKPGRRAHTEPGPVPGAAMPSPAPAPTSA
jgi:ATP-dependent DNA ligase